MKPAGQLYLLHFSHPLSHARHYLGWTGRADVWDRLNQHLAGNGSPLVAAAVAAGIEVTLAWTVPGSRGDERRLKRQKHTPRYCPLCRKWN